jgi:hypothetical protein
VPVAARDDDPKSIPQVATELWELSAAYARQETVDPLRGLGRFLGWGVGGAVVLGVGSILLLLAALRALQTETDTALTGNLSWIPYLVVAILATLEVVLVVMWIVKRKGPGL